ncbi:MAG: hypothetical protein R3B57_02235 [Phycisphaerales bacterium]
MRMPIAKVWRAFPELDRFDDDRCRVYVREAKTRHYGMGVLLAAGGVLVAIVFLVSTGIVASAIADTLPRTSEYDFAAAMISLALGVVWLSVLTAGTLLMRDRWLRAAIRDRLNRMACLGCRYNLLGLTPQGEPGRQHLVCPECGRQITLTPEMLEQLAELGVGSD